MNLVQAIVLGTIQGLTEFLPVSSSGHLVLFQRLFGLREAEMFFNVSVHMGTLGAVILFFRREIGGLLSALFRVAGGLLRRRIRPADAMADPEFRMAVLIVVGSVPTAIIGLLFRKEADRIFSSTFLVALMLLVTGTLLWATRRFSTEDREARERRNTGSLSCAKACIVGTAQGLAILPGISRSGATIAAGLFLGLDGPTAARYSFLLSIPAIVGAQILGLADLGREIPPLSIVLAGTATAALVGYGALALLVYLVNRGRMHLFAPYCWSLGALTLGLHFL